ncbi:hypothetical protein [Pseudobacillus badius]|uniref:hypothetical protein n=1 Tax=Bacillus badius TaxID=1455 RepID=UPI001304DC34|nr:hypothetical protein [Bacillus badius]GLY11779.1 hypothetical protein Bbad01_29950 [Bacillus badius]
MNELYSEAGPPSTAPVTLIPLTLIQPSFKIQFTPRVLTGAVMNGRISGAGFGIRLS